jgi:hypothetical protein
VSKLDELMQTEFEPLPEDFDFNVLKEEEIAWALEELVGSMSAAAILSYGDVYMVLREELNNEVLDLAAQRRLERDG